MLKNRIKKVRETLKIGSQEEFSEATSFPLARIKDLERGKVKTLKPDEAILLEEKFHFSGWWLLTGKGEMLLKEKCSAAPQVSTNDTYQVKRLTCKVSAGVGNHVESIDEFETGEIIEISKLLFRSTPSSKLRAIQVDGYSMIPMLFPDSWVFFENGGEYRGEGLYVINRDNELMVKLLQIDPYGKLIIKSVNPSYESWTIDMESQIVFNIVGKVVRTVI